MDHTIVGVRYIGKKPKQEDTVCRTGAIWLPDQVHNFGADLAKALLVHTDSFEDAPLSPAGNTYLSRGKAGQKSRDVAAFVNLNGMGIEQMAHFARLEFNRTVHIDGKDEAQVRREVHALMANNNLDLEAERRQEVVDDGKRLVPYMATPEEYAALMAGTVVLAIVPAEVFKSFSNENVPPSDLPIGADQDPDAPPEGLDNADHDQDAPQPEGTSDDAKPLPELLAGLEKLDLLRFAHQEGVGVSNAMTAEKLREKIFAELSARQQQKAA